MENGSIDVSVNDTLSKKVHTIQLTPSKAINSIFKEISKKYDYNIDDIHLVLESGPGVQSFFVSKPIFVTFNLFLFETHGKQGMLKFNNLLQFCFTSVILKLTSAY